MTSADGRTRLISGQRETRRVGCKRNANANKIGGSASEAAQLKATAQLSALAGQSFAIHHSCFNSASSLCIPETRNSSRDSGFGKHKPRQARKSLPAARCPIPESRSEAKRNETQRNETERNPTKANASRSESKLVSVRHSVAFSKADVRSLGSSLAVAFWPTRDAHCELAKSPLARSLSCDVELVGCWLVRWQAS